MFGSILGSLGSVFSSGASWLGSAAGGLFDWIGSNGSSLGGLGSLASGAASLGNLLMSPSTGSQINMQLNAQKELAAYQNALNVYDYQNRHQWEVEDLKKAGLNPILSANSGASLASGSGGLGSSVMSAEQAKAQRIKNNF